MTDPIITLAERRFPEGVKPGDLLLPTDSAIAHYGVISPARVAEIKMLWSEKSKHYSFTVKCKKPVRTLHQSLGQCWFKGFAKEARDKVPGNG